jgi:ammonia channel protein AmtB
MEDNDLEYIYLILGSILMLFMHVGFAMLQIGGIDTKRSRRLVIKTGTDLSISGLGLKDIHTMIILNKEVGWWLIGYGISYGQDQYQFTGKTKVPLIAHFISCFTNNIVCWD